MAGSNITYRANGPNSEGAQGYLAKPDQPNGKGVIVLQEYWGLVPHIKDVADRFAKLGYVALAPDLWDGTQTKDPDESFRRLMALEIDRAGKQIHGAIHALHAHGAKGKVGVIGFCMGGQLALYAATANPDEIGAAVDFYGIHPKVTPDFTKLTAPVLCVFAEQDQFVTTAAAKQLEATIRGAGKHVEAHHYPADHAFFNDTRPEVYAPGPAADAWKRTTEFFAKNL